MERRLTASLHDDDDDDDDDDNYSSDTWASSFEINNDDDISIENNYTTRHHPPTITTNTTMFFPDRERNNSNKRRLKLKRMIHKIKICHPRYVFGVVFLMVLVVNNLLFPEKYTKMLQLSEAGFNIPTNVTKGGEVIVGRIGGQGLTNDTKKQTLSFSKQPKNNNNSSSSSNSPAGHGVIILGMHRSGTSLLAGLLVTVVGYNVGGPLMPPKDENKKGFFERKDVAAQNDALLRRQGANWATRVKEFDNDLYTNNNNNNNNNNKNKKKKKKNNLLMKLFQTPTAMNPLKFMNDAINSPYMIKDPRLCLTLPSWRPFLLSPPATIVTYRHPLSVASSLTKRHNGNIRSLEQGLQLWSVYNARAIQHSRALCRVVVRMEDIYERPSEELRRVVGELEGRCGVRRGGTGTADDVVVTWDDDDVKHFVDDGLVHNTKATNKTTRVLANFNGCVVYDYDDRDWLGRPPPIKRKPIPRRKKIVDQRRKSSKQKQQVQYQQDHEQKKGGRNRDEWEGLLRDPNQLLSSEQNQQVRKPIPRRKRMVDQRRQSAKQNQQVQYQQLQQQQQRRQLQVAMIRREEYIKAMKIYCDMNSGAAFHPDYQFDF